jgi:hypothetical protein
MRRHRSGCLSPCDRGCKCKDCVPKCPTGPTGAPGAPGPTGGIGPTGFAEETPFSLLKFSGVAGEAQAGLQSSFLTDGLLGGLTFANVLLTRPGYLVAPGVPTRAFALAVRLLDSLAENHILQVLLLKNGVPAPGFSVVFTGPTVGPSTSFIISAVPEIYTPNFDELDVQVFDNHAGVLASPVRLSATVRCRVG